MKKMTTFIIGKDVEKPNEEIIELISEFRSEIPTLESEENLPFIILQDGKSLAYYTLCHIQASVAIPLVDPDAVLDPDEQELFRLQRELQPSNKAFIRMCTDALEKRQFSDIIAEYDTNYRSDIPLKILGGQHRTEAIKRALDQGNISRYQGFRIYFGLTIEQRNEIAQIANTNIAISTDLIDRMQETVRGPQLRNFYHKVGILDQTEDFADRKNPEGKITVRLARTFIVNFFEGKMNSDKDLEQSILTPYICKSGQEDPKYLSLIKQNIWENKDLIEAGENFAKLHTKQMTVTANVPDLDKPAFRNKAISMSAISSWAFVAGLLQNKKDALNKLYSLPDKSGKYNPLSAKTMSESSHPKDPPTYRGVGTRYTVQDRGRVTEMFIRYAMSNARRITGSLIEYAIMSYEAKVALKDRDRLRERFVEPK